MALLKCPDCGHNVSDQAETCPGCGCPLSKIKEAVAEQEAAMQAPKICQQCRHEIHTGTGICGHCGAFPGMAHEHTPQQKRIISVGKPWIKRLWGGGFSLPTSFWLFGIVFTPVNYLLGITMQFLLAFPLGFIIGRMSAMFELSISMHMNLAIILLVVLPISWLYCITWVVGTWRSSAQYTGSKMWKYSARAWLVCVLVLQALVDLRDLFMFSNM